MKQTLSTSLIGILALSLLSACGGGSGDDEPASAISADSLASPASTEASQASTEGSVSSSLTAADLQRNAADNVAINLESSLGSVERLFNDVMPMVDDFAGESGGAESADAGAEAGSMIDNVNIIPDNPDIAPMMDDAESAAGSFMLATLGLGENSQSRSTRSGNRVTIDPDDAEVCASLAPDLYSDDPFYGDVEAERGLCEELVSHVMVQIDARSDESGLITYLFDQQPLILIDYAPNAASIELVLGTLREVAVLAQSLVGESGGIPTIVQGRLRVAAAIINDQPGQEAGSLSLSVTEAILVQDQMLGINYSQSAASGIVVTADEAAGTASVAIDTGSIEAELNQPDINARLSMPGFTGNLELQNDGTRLVVSQLGLGNGPLSLSIDNQELLRLALSPFGFTLDESDQQVVFDADLDLAVVVRDFLGFDGVDVLLDATLQGPAGTRLLAGARGGDLVLGGGPLSLNYRSGLDGVSQTGFTTWSVGGCEQSPAPGAEIEPLFGCD